MVTVLRTPARPSEVHSLVEHGVIKMKNIFARFLKDESGATAIEYALIAAGIALAIITTVQLVGTNLNTKFQSIADKISTIK